MPILVRFSLSFLFFALAFSLPELSGTMNEQKPAFGHSNTHLIGLKCLEIVCVVKMIIFLCNLIRSVDNSINESVFVFSCLSPFVFAVLFHIFFFLSFWVIIIIIDAKLSVNVDFFRRTLQSQQIELTE